MEDQSNIAAGGRDLGEGLYCKFRPMKSSLPPNLLSSLFLQLFIYVNFKPSLLKRTSNIIVKKLCLDIKRNHSRGKNKQSY